MTFTDTEFLELCKKKIEEKYFPDTVESGMKQRDFEFLIDLIEEKSEIKISVSTLKRIWRSPDGQTPHPSTLNALVSVLGYKDWLAFKMKNPPDAKEKARLRFRTVIREKQMPVLATLGLTIVLFAAAMSLNLFNLEDSFDSENILFTANKTVSKGVPSTVIFNYDVKSIRADSFFIQQDWNPKHKDRIDPEGEYFSSIYYMPGFHKTKLIANETILDTLRVHIQTDGWMSAALYNYDDRPVYLEADRNTDGMLAAEEEDILNSQVDIERFSTLSFLNIRDFENLDGHNFTLETRFRYRDFLNNPCPVMRVTVHTEVHIYFIPLTLKGCVSNINLKIGEVYKSGRDNDLSVFGTDIRNWQTVKLDIEDKKGTVYLNGESVYETVFEEDFGRVVGLDYRFSGLGNVDYIWLKDLSGRMVYEDQFEELEQ